MRDMSLYPSLHTRLIKLQSTKELKRKSIKSGSKTCIWTQEEIDYWKRSTEEMYKTLQDNMVGLEPEFNKAIDEKFWDLI